MVNNNFKIIYYSFFADLIYKAKTQRVRCAKLKSVLSFTERKATVHKTNTKPD